MHQTAQMFRVIIGCPRISLSLHPLQGSEAEQRGIRWNVHSVQRILSPLHLNSLLLSLPSLPHHILYYFLPTAIDLECSAGCKLVRLSNGVCNALCNVPDCAFDGGDCVCVDPVIGAGLCTCPSGSERRDDGCECKHTQTHMERFSSSHLLTSIRLHHVYFCLPAYAPVGVERCIGHPRT